jgi:hypothetical protein
VTTILLIAGLLQYMGRIIPNNKVIESGESWECVTYDSVRMIKPPPDDCTVREALLFL